MVFRSLLLLLSLTLFVRPLYGYIDPGTGSYLLQILIAGGLAGLYTVKTYWKNISCFVKSHCSRKKQ
ncbi:hypothetical protein KKA53_01220 [Candidatus Dependentiae bacterium]|nr:hypothetical protein [Candidatus Dependentiae bacterium]